MCEFGAHGVSHVDLTRLDDNALSKELTASREFLQNILGAPVASMALPGGMGNARVIRAASRVGYRMIGNSVPLNHAKADVRVNRVCIYRSSGQSEPLRLTQMGRSYWLRARMKTIVSSYCPRVIGEPTYRVISEFLKPTMNRGGNAYR